jgi:hypothetical protein
MWLPSFAPISNRDFPDAGLRSSFVDFFLSRFDLVNELADFL